MTDNTDNIEASATPEESRYKRVRVNGRSEMKHRAIMEKILGYKIPEGCVVHHKDKNVLNNDPSNLQLMTEEAHTALHKQDRIDAKHRAIPVCSLDDNGNVIKIYESMQATECDGYKPSLVCSCLHGKQATHGGVHWGFASDKRPIPKNRPVIAVDPYTGKEARYTSAAEACRICDLNTIWLGAILRGKAAVWRYKGLIWLYESEREKLPGIIKACIEYDKSRRPAVRCYDTHTGKLVKEYDDAITAEQQVKAATASAIQKCCTGRCNVKTSGGYIWRFASEQLEHVEPIMKYIARYNPVTGEILGIYRTPAGAELLEGVNKSRIANCCAGRFKTIHGEGWKHLTPEEIPADIPGDRLHLEFQYTKSHVV